MVSRKTCASAPSKRAAKILMPLTSTAWVANSSPWLAANLEFTFSNSRSAWRKLSCSWVTRLTKSPGWVLSTAAASLILSSRSCKKCKAFCPVTASTRRIPAATPLSETILRVPISPVRATCVPPQSSFELPISSTRTSSPYFSPKSIMAPVFWASSKDITFAEVAALVKISRLTISSTCLIWAAVMGALCVKSKRVLLASTKEPFCCTWSPKISRKALCRIWVALWLRMVSVLCSTSTSALMESPTLSSPSATSPWWPNTSAWILKVSSTVKRTPSLRNSPLSPTWPPDSA